MNFQTTINFYSKIPSLFARNVSRFKFPHEEPTNVKLNNYMTQCRCPTDVGYDGWLPTDKHRKSISHNIVPVIVYQDMVPNKHKTMYMYKRFLTLKNVFNRFDNVCTRFCACRVAIGLVDLYIHI